MALTDWYRDQQRDPALCCEKHESREYYERRERLGCNGCAYKQEYRAWGRIIDGCKFEQQPGPRGFCTLWDDANAKD